MKQKNNTAAPSQQPGNGKTVYGLVGFPLGHSFSARYFAGKFATEGINAEYRNFEIPEIGMLPKIISNTPSLRGLNVTIPYKQQIIPLLDELDDNARRIGAVNVVCASRNAEGNPHLTGRNADVIGFTGSLRPLLRPTHKKALVLGTGGASRAVIHGLKMLGISPLPVSRTPSEGVITYKDITPAVINEYKLIVNTTPLGMFPKTDRCPDIPYQLLTPEHLLYDLVYNPEETLFLQRGREYGAAVKNGLEMLHLQAEASWRFWNGESIDAFNNLF